MTICVICRFEVPVDDAVVPTAAGRCICLGCFARETESKRPMPPGLRRQLRDLLTVVEAA